MSGRTSSMATHCCCVPEWHSATSQESTFAENSACALKTICTSPKTELSYSRLRARRWKIHSESDSPRSHGMHGGFFVLLLSQRSLCYRGRFCNKSRKSFLRVLRDSVVNRVFTARLSALALHRSRS